VNFGQHQTRMRFHGRYRAICGKDAFNFCGLVHWFLPPIVSRTSNFFYDNGGSLARPSRCLPVSRRRAQITSPVAVAPCA
jgi:hypothetical protein